MWLFDLFFLNSAYLICRGTDISRDLWISRWWLYLVKKFPSFSDYSPYTFIHLFIKAYVVGTHLKLRQFRWVPTTYAFIKKKNQKKNIAIASLNTSLVKSRWSSIKVGHPRWLSWMGIRLVIRRLHVWSQHSFVEILIMKYFLWSFSPFCWFKKGSCQFLAKECVQYWLTA